MNCEKAISRKERFRNREEWLSARGIGGSDLAALMNQSKWGDPQSLYDRLTGKKDKPRKQSERMAEGANTEASIRNLFRYDFAKDFDVTDPPKGNWLWRREDKPYITCSPDGMLKRKGTGEMGGLEIKNVDLIKSEDVAIWEANQLPQQYYWQAIQYFVAIPEIGFVVLYAHLKHYAKDGEEWKFAYAEDRPYFLYRSDEETRKRIEYAERKETEFIENNVMKGKRPTLIIKFLKF